MNVIDEIRNDARGLELLTDWLGDDGKPVDRELAECRSFICELCPENRPGPLWEVIKHMAAMWIRGEIEIKHKLSMVLPNEDKLGMCRACGCCNRLKCWTPIDHINNHFNEKARSKLPPSCWMIGELKEL